MLFFWSLSVLPIIPMVIPQSTFNPNVGMIAFAVFANTACITMGFLAVQGRYIGSKVETILMNSYAISKDERTKQIMNKIAVHQKDVVKGGVMQSFIYGFFG